MYNRRLKYLPLEVGISEEVFTTTAEEVCTTIALLQKKCVKQQLFKRRSVYHKSCVGAEVFTIRAV